ncbi:MAG: peptidoglycan-binding protein [Propionibacteriaceae bacterium]|nr:peptidoglycan-binding protein [Propionibacteriaceae bacterium]
MQAALQFCRGGEGNLPILDSIDGIWGPNTTSVLRAIQRFKHIPADGQYGPQTHNALSYFTWEGPAYTWCAFDPNV